LSLHNYAKGNQGVVARKGLDLTYHHHLKNATKSLG